MEMKTGLSWEEAQERCEDREDWRRCVDRCVRDEPRTKKNWPSAEKVSSGMDLPALAADGRQWKKLTVVFVSDTERV